MVKNNDLRFSYNKMADVLYMSIGTPRECIGEMTDEGIIVKLDPDNAKKIIGITILDFQKRFSKPHAQALPINMIAKLQPA